MACWPDLGDTEHLLPGKWEDGSLAFLFLLTAAAPYLIGEETEAPDG